MNAENTTRFVEPIVELIRRRKSVRTYSNRPVPADVQEKIRQYFQPPNGPFQAAIRFELLNQPAIKADSQIKLGTYGMIQGASLFIAAAVEKKDRHLEQLGYVFEDLILYLTSLGLGTCWLAGTFTKNQFAKAMRTGNNEILPIVTPVGYPGIFRSPIDLLLKPIPALKQRKPWNTLFFQDSFNTILNKSEAGAYALPLEMVRLAPSASNKQPWRIIQKNGAFHFCLAHDPVYSHRYPYDIQKIDLGIAMFHFESTAQESGLKGRWENQTPIFENVPAELEYIITWVPA
jgi:hypothetical protein